MTSLREKIEAHATAEGFDLVGVAPIAPPPDAERFVTWLAEGKHGEMDYLERFRDRILDPSKVLDGARSIISLGVNHARAAGGFRGGGRVARYALGRDYHNVIDGMTRRLVKRLRADGIGEVFRNITDAGPALERSLASRAGVGFLSKSANLLNYKYGPWFFLAEIFIDVEVEPIIQKSPGSCGTCVQCIQLCPTGAIVAPGNVDARICISYLTIELRGKIPVELRPKMQDWVFGCDVCSEVCPFGDGTPDAASRFGTHAALELTLDQILQISEEDFKNLFVGSPMRRAKREGLARNAAIAIGNLARRESATILQKTIANDPSEVVRDAASWALQRL